MSEGDRLARATRWLWLVPLGLGALLFTTPGVKLGPDGAWYMALALNIQNGLGYLNSEWMPETRRGPVFASALALGFEMRDVSTESAVVVARIFYILNSLVLYALGGRLYGRAAGLAASLLALVAFPIRFWSGFVLLDHVMPTFALAAVLAQVRGIQSPGRAGPGWSLLAGLLFGLAVLTKETALVLAPLPLLLWLMAPAAERPRTAATFVPFYASAAFCLTPWAAWLVITGEGIGGLSGGVIGIVSGGVQSTVGGVGGSLAAVWQRVLGRDLSEFPFSLLQLVALPFVLERGLRARAFPDRVVAALILLTLPLLVTQLWLGLRAGQSFIVLLLGCLASARLISAPLGWRWSLGRRRAATALALLVAVQVELQVGVAKLVDRDGNEIGKTLAFAWMTNPARRFAVRGWDNPAVTHAGRWIRANVPAGERIMSDWHWSDSLYVAIGGDRPLARLPVIASRSLDHSALDARRKPGYEGSAQPVLFLWSQAGREDPANPEAWLNALSEPQLLSALREFRIRWLVLTQRRNFIVEYLDVSPSFARAVFFGDDDIVIYRVHPRPQPIAFETRLRLGAAGYLLRLREERPARFELMRRRFLEQRLGFAPDAIQAMLGEG